MFERYTERARRALFFARFEASMFGSTTIDTEHLLLGILREPAGVVQRAFKRHNASPAQVRDRMTAGISAAPKVATSVEIPFSAEVRQVLQSAAGEADRLQHRDIGPEHLLLGILRLKGSAAAVLEDYGIRYDEVRSQMAAGGGHEDTAPTVPSNAADEARARIDGIGDLVEELGRTTAGSDDANRLVIRILRELQGLKDLLGD